MPSVYTTYPISYVIMTTLRARRQYASLLRPVSTSANSAARPSDGLSGHAQLEIQAESECLMSNALSVLEVESSSTFSRPE